MGDYTYRLTETDHYQIADSKCKAVYLMARSDTKKDIEAVVSPDMGMSLLHFSIDRVPILQKSRQNDFLEGRKGFGPLILPHFNQRASFPAVPDNVLKESEHIPYLKKNGITDPFQHGIGRYASWDYEVRIDEDKISVAGTLTGESTYLGIPVSNIVGYGYHQFQQSEYISQ